MMVRALRSLYCFGCRQQAISLDGSPVERLLHVEE